jgi:glycosyltransferase involved in cell wall biosynthesis
MSIERERVDSLPQGVMAEPWSEWTGAIANQHPETNQTLSIIIRFHMPERLPFLDEALFSLAIQAWPDLELVIAVQNGTEELKQAIAEIFDRQPWPSSPPPYAILLVSIPEGMDGRSTLLNRGIDHATGRYLAFLDDDDVVYQHGYSTLIGQLENSGLAVAVGGCRTARVQRVSDHWFVLTKEMPFAWGRTRNDLLRDNFIPIHSYVIHRALISPGDLYFNDECPPLEDYDFLLRLCAKYEFDFSQLEIPVCEYRIHTLNSIPYTADAPPSAFASHARAQEIINEKKKTLQCAVSVGELVDLLNKLREQERERAVMEARLLQSEIDKQTGERRFLNTVTRKTYQFFGRFPSLEVKVSNATHAAWKAYKGIKAKWINKSDN